MRRALPGLGAFFLLLLVSVEPNHGGTSGGPGAFLGGDLGVGGRSAVAAGRGKPARRPAPEVADADTGASLDSALPTVLGRPSPAVPEALKPWVPWVLHGQEEALCPFLHGQGPAGSSQEEDDSAIECSWPARLALQLRDKGGSFTQTWRLYKRGWVKLPGDSKTWPQEVRVDGQPAVVANAGASKGSKSDDSDGESALPQVLLLPGEHTVTGTFVWDEVPESLLVPPATGLLTLALGGKEIPQPTRDEKGRVFLQKTSTAIEEDVLEVTVHRRIIDEIPLRLVTRIELRVAGKSREVLLGKTLDEKFIPMQLESTLPARLAPDSRLRVQVRPGTYTLTLTARHEGPAALLRRPDPQGTWAADEVWVMDARPALRVVVVDGVQTLDPQQTTLPDEWKKLPAYRVRDKDVVELKERQRGDSAPAPDRLSLRRELFLDFDGQGYTVSDVITGALSRTWRLEVNAPTELGRVAVDRRDQLITRGKADGTPSRAGVELRQGKVRIDADSRMPRSGPLSAVSWNTDFHQVSGILHLPPGWRLLHMSGADDVKGTWLRHYTLLDLFLVLIVAMAVGRLFGIGWGLLALVALALCCPETDAPRWVWLAPLLVEGLSRVLPSGWPRVVLAVARAMSRVALAVLVVVFAAQQLRYGLYPALERSGETNVEQQLDNVIGGEGVVYGSYETNVVNAPASDLAKTMSHDSALGNAAPEPMGGLVNDESSDGPGMAGKADFMNMKKKPKLQQEGRIPDIQQQAQQQMEWQQSKNGSILRTGKLGRKNSYEYDPQAAVQTGPGMPRWRWNKIPIDFSGPVDHEQTLNLWLMGPLVNLVLAWVQVLLLALLTLKLCGLRRPGSRPRAGLGGAATALVLLAVSFGGLPTARAQLPTQEMLDELRTRLLEKPECRPYCASSPRLVLEIQPRLLRARMEVGVTAATAVPLPGGASQWLPEQVLVDGKPATALLSRDDKLWLVLPAGSHLVQLEGRLASRETVQIALPLKSHRVEARVTGWQLAGLHEDGLADDNLQLTREVGGQGQGQGQGQEQGQGRRPGQGRGLGVAPGGSPAAARARRARAADRHAVAGRHPRGARDPAGQRGGAGSAAAPRGVDHHRRRAGAERQGPGQHGPDGDRGKLALAAAGATAARPGGLQVAGPHRGLAAVGEPDLPRRAVGDSGGPPAGQQRHPPPRVAAVARGEGQHRDHPARGGDRADADHRPLGAAAVPRRAVDRCDADHAGAVEPRRSALDYPAGQRAGADGQGRGA